MSVYTVVTVGQAQAWLDNYSLGSLVALEPIAAGIENTNYFLTTTQGSFVLTLFEVLKAHELAFYLELMAHLAQRGIPCPRPVADKHGALAGRLNGKPAAIATRLRGAPVEAVGVEQCATMGGVLARMHLAALDYGRSEPNPRGLAWCGKAAETVRLFLRPDSCALLTREIAFHAAHARADLPRGAIHADLFRDNVLWADDAVGGMVDFYFACTDALLLDVAVTVNDWCVTPGGEIDEDRATALLAAYHRIRPFCAAESETWNDMLRFGALRFWLSRLYDLHLPRAGVLTHAEDPRHFERMLQQRVTLKHDLTNLLPA